MSTLLEDLTKGTSYEDFEKKKRIEFLKKKLADTDYMAIKYAEGALSYLEYEQMKEQRQAWRDEINSLEGN